MDMLTLMYKMILRKILLAAVQKLLKIMQKLLQIMLEFMLILPDFRFVAWFTRKIHLLPALILLRQVLSQVLPPAAPLPQKMITPMLQLAARLPQRILPHRALGLCPL
jgi:hypothetical protein